MKKEDISQGFGTPLAKNKYKVIIPQKEINYIDTLYLMCNLQDFCNEEHLIKYANFVDYNPFEVPDDLKYFVFHSYLAEKELINVECIGNAEGRTWYKFDNYRLGIMDYDLAKKSNQYNCVIQYEHSHLFNLPMNLKGLDLPFGDELEKYKIKRFDITKTAKLKKNYTYGYGYISPFKQHAFRFNRVEETTVYLGRRSNGCVFRIYDKGKELSDTKNYEKMSKFESIFDSLDNLYTFELELRRSYMRDALGIDNLSEIEKLLVASKNIISKIRFIKDTPRNKKLYEQKHLNMIKSEVLTEFVEFERPKKKQYARSYNAMIKRIKKEIENYVNCYPELDNIALYTKIVNSISQDVADGKDLEIYIDNSQFKNDYDTMFKKFENQRKNQLYHSNLEFEAWYYLKRKPDVDRQTI